MSSYRAIYNSLSGDMAKLVLRNVPVLTCGAAGCLAIAPGSHDPSVFFIYSRSNQHILRLFVKLDCKAYACNRDRSGESPGRAWVMS